MDVQTENMDPPPCESQSSGKIRKGFKLFGKRKPGNIFSIRNKGDGNNKSPVNRSKTIDGLSDTAAPDSEQEPDREKGQEVTQGEMEQAEEEALGEDGVLAAAHGRTSISSASSAKSLTFLSLLRGGRRGTGDRRVHTVSQPVGRQRRGLKGLFGNVKFRSKDKEDKEETPPSPLLMSSRANSVEIIKEDLTLTPKSQPRSLDSPESREPVKSLATQDSAATSPSETLTPQVTAGNVSKTNEHVPPLPTSESPLVPGDNSLSSLLADISSLLTFDSISGGGDIMADVEAEWGKASSAISAVVTEVTPSSTSLFSKPSVSSPKTPTSVSTAATTKPSSVAVLTTASSKSSTLLTKTTSSSSPIAKPSTIITTFTKSSTLTSQSPASEPSTSVIKSAPTVTTGKPSTTLVTVINLSSSVTSSPLMTIKSSPSSTSTIATAPSNTTATVVKTPSDGPTLSSMTSKLASDTAAPPQMVPSVIKPGPVASPPPVSAKMPPVTHSPPAPVALTQPTPAKLDSVSNLNSQISTSHKHSLSSAAGESKVPVTTVHTAVTASGLVSVVFPKPLLTSVPVDSNRTTPSLVTVCPSSTQTASSATKPSPVSVPTSSSTSSDKIPPTTEPPSLPVSLDKMPPVPTATPAPGSHAVVSTASLTPPAPGQIPVSQSKTPPAPAQIPMFVSKDSPAPAQIQVSQSKAPPAPIQIPVSVSKDLSFPAQIPVSVSKDPPVPAHIQISVSKGAPAPAQIEVSQSKVPTSSAQIPVSVSKDPPAPAQIPVSISKNLSSPAQIQFSVSKDPPAAAQIQVSQPKAPSPPAQIPVSVSTDPFAPVCIPISVSKDPPATAQIPISQSKAPTSAPVTCPVTSLPSTPAPRLSEATASATMKGSGQASADGQLASPGCTEAQGAQTVPSKTDEYNESRTNLQGPSKERRTPHGKTSGLSKIPVVGGGRVGKIPVRESHHVDDEASRDPPTPVREEERPHFNSHDLGSKDKISDAGVIVPTPKHTQEESQQPPQPKVLTSLPRDSKIPVKHGTQSHTASQIPQAKEPPRTKIPVSKVPVRRVGNKPAAAAGSNQIRK
uniref:mucin-5AC n=1 Tax=Scatophagus argus TaxID=75038 RepID=UPI001ED7D66E|nr:mucin-5AC [Scatophagus argus]